MQLFGSAESTMAQTFEWRQRQAAGAAREDEGTSDGVSGPVGADIDADLTLLKNLLESHSQGLGLPLGPASNMLAQFGLAMPTPPPMNKQQKTTGGNKKTSESVCQ